MQYEIKVTVNKFFQICLTLWLTKANQTFSLSNLMFLSLKDMSGTYEVNLKYFGLFAVEWILYIFY
jgi:hypothetical protein